MRIVIVGAGDIGSSLAEHLCQHGHQISVIDPNAEVCARLGERLDVLTVVGRGTSPSALEAAGIRSAAMLIAVTPNDDTNIVVCGLAEQYGVAKRVARVGSVEYTDENNPINLTKLGVTDIIEPEKEMVRAVLNYIELPGATEAANFQDDGICLRGYRVTSDMPIANRTISEIPELRECGRIVIVLVVRHGLSIIPSGQETILPEDEIVAIMTPDAVPIFRAMVNRPSGKVKKVVLYGDSPTSAHLALALPACSERVIFVDPDERHAQEVAAKAPGVEVLYGDCTRSEMLQEVHVETADFYVAAARDTEDSIMSCLLARAEGAHEVISVGGTGRHARIFASLGIDHLITPHEITLQTIVARVLKVPIGALLKVRSADVEVHRFLVTQRSKAAGRRVRELATLQVEPFIIGSIIRGDGVLIPSGDTLVEAGDEVLVVSQSEGSTSVRRLFEGGLLFP